MGNIRRYLPSGRFLTIALSCLVTLGIVFGATLYPQKTTSAPDALSILGADSVSNLIASADTTDSDKDGLADWEEVLWGSNPKLSDTDQDGTSDGEEVLTGRNPTIKGPKDVLLKTSANGSEGVAELSATDKLAREFFTEYAKTKQSDGTVTNISSANIIASTLSRSDILSSARAYTEGELSVRKLDSEAILREYAEAMGLIQKENALDTSAETELSIFKKALDTNSKEKLLELSPIALRYETIVKAMLALPVPAELVPLHLALLNDMSAILFSVNAMKNAFTDPVGALAGVSEYLKRAAEIPADYKAFAEHFAKRNIVFASQSAGYLFLNTYK